MKLHLQNKPHLKGFIFFKKQGDDVVTLSKKKKFIKF